MKKLNNLYIDLEWYQNQEIFIIGYKHSFSPVKQIHGKQINKSALLKILKPVTGCIFFYGPDVGMLEKNFKIDIRNKFRCQNLHPLAKRAFPNLKNYQLATIEKHLKLKRSQPEYKKDIFRMVDDYKNPKKRERALEYNREDVINLVKAKAAIYKSLSKKYNLEKLRLK